MTIDLETSLLTTLALYFPVLLAGTGIGLFFFSTLWITVYKGLNSANPALWFLAGLIVRMSVSLSLFYWLASDDWRRLVVSLLGFIIGRQCVKWLTASATATPPNEAVSNHAS